MTISMEEVTTHPRPFVRKTVDFRLFTVRWALSHTRKEVGMKRFLFMVMVIPVIWIPTPGSVVIAPPPQPGKIHIAPPPQPGQVEILLLRETQETVRTFLSGPAFLEKTNGPANRLGIRIIMVKPLPRQEFPQDIRYPFSVEIKSKYEAMVKFLYSLENRFGLTVDHLHIENDIKNSPWHRFTFTVSSFQWFDHI